LWFMGRFQSYISLIITISNQEACMISLIYFNPILV